MAHFLPPTILSLFAPRPPLLFKPPMRKRNLRPIDSIAQYLDRCIITEDTNTNEQVDSKADDNPKDAYNPHDNPNATSESMKTIFVGRLDYGITESDLKREFGRYGRVEDVKIVKNNITGKSRGYAFIQFANSQDVVDAYHRADGIRIGTKRVVVDVERGRTVANWKPRRLGGGKGMTRKGSKEMNQNYYGREKTKAELEAKKSKRRDRDDNRSRYRRSERSRSPRRNRDSRRAHSPYRKRSRH